jgi:hypothetical protein
MILTPEELHNLRGHLALMTPHKSKALIRDLHLQAVMAALSDDKVDLDHETIDRLVTLERQQKAKKLIHKI